MSRTLSYLAALVLVAAAVAPLRSQGGGATQTPPPARANVAGDWMIYLSTMQPTMFRGAIAQAGEKLTGYMGNEAAEFPIKGTVEGVDVKFSWTIIEGGEDVEITITGKIEKESMSGRAKIGRYADVEMSGQRVGQ